MTTFAGMLTTIYVNLDEASDDSATVTLVKSWVNQIAQEIQRKAGIRGLQVEGTADFVEDATNMPLAITTAHNSRSYVVRIIEAYLEELEYDSGWTTTGTKYRLTEISYADYLQRMIASDDTGTPAFFSLALPTAQGDTDGTYDVNAYLYPPPDSDDTEDSTGKRWRLHFYGEASIGPLSSDSDVVYPVGADDLFILGAAHKQCLHDKDYQGAQMQAVLFRDALNQFVAREHVHTSMYIMGRNLKGKEDHFTVVEVLTEPS